MILKKSLESKVSDFYEIDKKPKESDFEKIKKESKVSDFYRNHWVWQRKKVWEIIFKTKRLLLMAN